MKIAICIPSGGSWAAEFGLSLIGVLASSPGLELTVLSRCTSLHVLTRTALAREALALGADALLWLDADMTFPPDTLTRLLAHRRDFVAAAAARRNAYPIEPTTSIDLSPGGLRPAPAAGLACAYTARSVFERASAPWFAPYWDVGGNYVGEDTAFALNARAAGIPVWIDADLSREVGHIGTAEYALAPKRSAGGHPVLHA